jgi:hypothetical protein
MPSDALARRSLALRHVSPEEGAMSDKTPWEEKWIQHPSNTPTFANAWVVYGGGNGPIVVTTAGVDRARFISAAPDMARALLAHGSYGGVNDSAWHTKDCWGGQNAVADRPCTSRCLRTSAALKKGGVIP